MRAILFFVLLSLTILDSISAQYFGRNKPTYERFNFKKLETPTYEIYHYLNNDQKINEFAQWSEQWYELHLQIMQDTFVRKNPFILYRDHADFQQTSTINGTIGVSTGGVTEAFKNRVVMPLAFTNQQTWHVLGHELVHAFQFRMILGGDSTNLQSLGNLPLWMVEGMAEYMSLGRHDSHTAMWMRDAVARDDIPEFKQLAHPKYFPYRYGQAMWSVLTGIYGDNVLKPYFMNTAKYGLEVSTPLTLGITTDELSDIWQRTLREHYGPLIAGKDKDPLGKEIINKDNAGRLNVSPSLSPNGRYVIFLSEKDLFSTDLFLANASNGEIIRKVASSAKGGHIDEFNFIESSGTWSPDSEQFAYVAFSKGGYILVIKDVESGDTVEEYSIADVPAISNPAWSPDGKSIVFTGMVEGQTDLFQLFLKNQRLVQLTDDTFSEIQASWHPDGDKIVFASDRLSYPRNRVNGKWTFNISELDLLSGSVTDRFIFKGADNLNPQYDSEGNIFFISDRDGFRNLYKFDPVSENLYQMTDLVTGISGITPYAPAFSVSSDRKRDRILYSYYQLNNYNIYQSSTDKMLNREVDPTDVDMTAGILPIADMERPDIVNHNLKNLYRWDEYPDSEFEEGKYKSKLKLDFVTGGGGVGVQNNTTFGPAAGAQGGIVMLFSDLLGENSLITQLNINGDVQDFGAAAQYFNRKGRFTWGLGLSHTPNRFGQQFVYGENVPDLGPVITRQTDLTRIFEDQLSGVVHYPFNKTQRWELTGGGAYRFASGQRIYDYFDPTGSIILGQRVESVDVNFDNGAYGFGGTAFVSDNSIFATTSPIKGHRVRLAYDHYVGQFDFNSITADLRQYSFLGRTTLAFRFQHYARFGNDAERLSPLYIGNPFLVRGYGFNNILALQDLNRDPNTNRTSLPFDGFQGSKFALGNIEWRIPFTGIDRLALIPTSFLFTELSLFADAGYAFSEYSEFSDETLNAKPLLASSVGVSLRVNLFGALILEPYYAYAIQDKGRGTFGFNFWPGW